MTRAEERSWGQLPEIAVNTKGTIAGTLLLKGLRAGKVEIAHCSFTLRLNQVGVCHTRLLDHEGICIPLQAVEVGRKGIYIRLR